MRRRTLPLLGLALAGSLLALTIGCSDGEDETSCQGLNCSGGGPANRGGSGGALTTSGGTVAAPSGGVTAQTGGTTNTGGTTLGTGGTAPETGGTAAVSGGASPGGAGGNSAGTAPGGVGGDQGGSHSPAGAGGTAGGTAGQSGAGADSGGSAGQGQGGMTAQGGTQTAGGLSGGEGGESAGRGGGTAAGGLSGGEGGTSGTSGGVGGASGGEGGSGGLASYALLKYDFEETAGTTVTDVSGNGNDGTLVNATFTAATEGRNGAAASLAIADSAVSLPNDVLAGVHQLSVSAWVYLTANASGSRLFDLGTSLTNHLYVSINNGSGGTELGLVAGGTTQTVYTNTLLPLNVWKHVTVTMSSAGTSLYVDGGEVVHSPSVIDPAGLGATNSNWIGRSLTPGDPTFAGRVDEFYMFRRALTLEEIRQLAWPKTDYSIWRFDEGSGTIAHDSSDNARHGTLVNMDETSTPSAWATGMSGGAVALANSPQTNDRYVQLPTGVVQNCTQGLTVSAWIRLATVFPQAKVFTFGNDSTNPKQFVYGRTMGGSTVGWVFMNGTDGNGAGDHAPNLNINWTIGDWYHVAAVRNGQTVTAYVDGSTTGLSGTVNPRTLADTVPQASAMGTTEINYIGKSLPSWNENLLHGLVDEFLLSCRPYTADEIRQLAYRR